ncbi:ABC transporter ATP-binding protein [Humibacter sp. BT305]|nr:ABC transporter ATP-binding protein [Humibacter sp. BT305]
MSPPGAQPSPGAHPPSPGAHPPPALELTATVAERDFAASLSIAPGETVAVLGPNGAGKSTLLGLLAGLVRPTSGRAVLGADVLFDLPPAAPVDGAEHTQDARLPAVGNRVSRGHSASVAVGRRTWTPPHERGVTLLAQEALLFPHLTARQNVEFGPRSRGASRAAARAAGERWLTEVDALSLAERRPAQLSGGQAQRIALARALASEPRLLLLDEPMAALDVHVRPALRRMLRDVLADRTAVIVTHDVLDALVLADRVIVIADGRVRAEGPTRAVLERPTDPFTAELASLNLVTGTAVASRAPGREDAVTDAVELPDGRRLPVAPTALPPGARVGVAIPPAALRMVTDAEPAAPGQVNAIVRDLEPRGDLVRVRTDLLFVDLAPAVVADLDLLPDTRIRLHYDPVAAVAYPLP